MKTIKLILSSLIIALLFASCNNAEPVLPTEDWDSPVQSIGAGNRVIYEMNVRNFSKEGTLAAAMTQIDRLYTLGVDIIWLMPIHPIGVEGRSGSMGSPYSVKDYMSVNPDYGTLEDFKNFVSAAHSKGIKVWMDWVPNHTAKDHPWVTEHPEYYAGARPYSPAGWPDVYQLDMRKEATHTAMIECMQYWVEECDIDGFRFDYASSDMISTSFWASARAAIDPIKRIEWMAEADFNSYDPDAPKYEETRQYFDFDYAWRFNSQLDAFVQTKNVDDLRKDCEELFNDARYKESLAKMVYVTNHDLNADDGTEFDRFSHYLYNITALTFTIYDMPLLYNGQEVGDDQRMNLVDKQTITWGNTDDKIELLIKKLCRLKRTTPALTTGAQRGSLYLMPTEDQDKLFSFKRSNGASEVIVIMNFSGKSVESQFAGIVPTGVYRDYLDGGDVTFTDNPTFTIPAYSCKIYRK